MKAMLRIYFEGITFDSKLRIRQITSWPFLRDKYRLFCDGQSYSMLSLHALGENPPVLSEGLASQFAAKFYTNLS